MTTRLDALEQLVKDGIPDEWMQTTVFAALPDLLAVAKAAKTVTKAGGPARGGYVIADKFIDNLREALAPLLREAE